jgi:hypothetical protein
MTENPHPVYTITAHHCPEGSNKMLEVGKTITVERDMAIAMMGAYAEKLGTSPVDASAEAQAAIEKADHGSKGSVSLKGGYILVDPLKEEISTARPAVAMVLSPGRTDPVIVCGYWQDDGYWADADCGLGAVGLLETVGNALRECERRIGRDSVSVVCQSFTGQLTETYTYRPGFPEVGPVDLPTDPANSDV